MFVTLIEVTPRKQDAFYRVSGVYDNKRETIAIKPRVEAMEFAKKLEAYCKGVYDSEVFEALNAVAQGRAED